MTTSLAAVPALGAELVRAIAYHRRVNGQFVAAVASGADDEQHPGFSPEGRERCYRLSIRERAAYQALLASPAKLEREWRAKCGYLEELLEAKRIEDFGTEDLAVLLKSLR